MRAQQLIEQRAVGVPVVGGAGARGGGQQFEAVADPHRRGVSALDGHDDRDVGQRLLLALQSDPALTQRGELGERRPDRGCGPSRRPGCAGPGRTAAASPGWAGSHRRRSAPAAPRSGAAAAWRGRCRPTAASPVGPRRRWRATAAANCRRAAHAASPAPPAPPIAGCVGCSGCPTRTAPPAPGPPLRTGAPRWPATTRRPAAAETPRPVARRWISPIPPPAAGPPPAPPAACRRRSRPGLTEEDLQALGAVPRRWWPRRIAVASPGVIRQ